jgi:hypothetical protein
MRFSTPTAAATSVARCSSARLNLLVSASTRARVVTRHLLPANALALSHRPEVLVAPGWRRLGCVARHSTGAGWHDDSSIGVPRGDLTVDAVLAVGAVGSERSDWVRDLIEQGTNLGGVIDIVRRQGGRGDLSGVGIHIDVQLAP